LDRNIPPQKNFLNGSGLPDGIRIFIPKTAVFIFFIFFEGLRGTNFGIFMVICCILLKIGTFFSHFEYLVVF
jgi:hypothetical protein